MLRASEPKTLSVKQTALRRVQPDARVLAIALDVAFATPFLQ
jgi:hypothetical protein